MRRGAGCVLLLLPALVQAADNSDDIYAMNLAQLAQLKVSTPTRTPESLQHTAGTVLVFTREDIRERGYRNLGELLQALPGVYVQGNSSADSYNRISWRGLAGNDKFIVMQNGVRIAAPAGEPLAITDNFPLYYARRVEIVYGPGSALYGTDALSGVINIITDTAEGGESLQVQGERGNEGYDRGSVAAHLAGADNVRISAGAQRQGADNSNLAAAYPQQLAFGNLDNAQGQVVVPAAARNAFDNDTSSWQAFADALFGKHWQLGYNGYHFTQPSTVGDKASFDNYGDSLTTDIHTLYSRYRFAPSEQLSGEVMANYSHYELTPDSGFDNQLTGYTTLFKYAESQRRQLEIVLNEQWRPDQLLTGGLVGEEIQAIPKTADLTAPYMSGESAQQQGLYYAGTNNTLPVQLFNVHYHDLGAFLQEQSTWTPQLRSVVGVRYDHYSDFGGTLNPRFTLTWEPASQHKISLLAGRAFLAPSPYFTYELFGSFNGTQNGQGQYQSDSMHIPNTGLGPERVQTFELDHQWLPSEQWQLATTLYHNRLSGYITTIETSTPVSNYVPGGVIAATSINANGGEVDISGIDIRLDHSCDIRSGHLKNWISFSYAGGEQDTAAGSQPIPYTPKEGAKAGSTWAWGNGYSISPSVYAASPSPTEHAGEQAPGYAVANIYGRKENIVPHLNGFARVDNLFDRPWYNAASGGSTTLSASPQNRRTFTVGVELEL